MRETDVAVLNATIPRRDYKPRDDHLQERIKGSTYLDFKGITDGSTGLYYSMPGPELFASKMREMNVGKRDLVVVYDKYRNISAPRVHFMLSQVFGMPHVWLLNGTFDKWKAEGRALETGESPQAFRRQGAKTEDDFNFEYNKSKLLSFEDMQALVQDKQAGQGRPPILDGRLASFFEKAHLPTSKSVPFNTLMDKDYNFLPADQLLKIFQAAGVADPEKDEVYFSCQRGITACIVEFALRTLGNENTRLYDGSLEEWAKRTGMVLPKDH